MSKFQVCGDFLDALQALFELHYIFHLSYAIEIRQFCLLIENLAGLNLKTIYGTRHWIYEELQNHEAGKLNFYYLNPSYVFQLAQVRIDPERSQPS